MSNNTIEAIDQKTRTQKTSSHHSPPPPPPAPSFIFRGHDAPIHSLEFFGSNTFLATGDETGWVYVWDIWKRRPVCKWHAHKTGSVLGLKAIPFHQMKPLVPLSTSTMSNNASSTLQSPSRRNLMGRTKMTGLEESVYIVSHGRDNEIHFWDINSVLQESIRRSSSIRIIDLSESTGSRLAMTPILSLPVNALNFCKMAILAVDNDSKDISDTPESATKRESQDATETTTMKTGACVLRKTHRNIFVAVPSPTTSSLIDIYDVTKPERTFAAVGPFDTTPSDFGSANVQPMGSDKKWGSVMSIRLYLSRSTVDDGNNMQARKERLHMLVGYEDGSVTLFQDSNVSSTTTMDDITGSTTRKSKRTMEVIWSMKCHREPVLAVDVSSKAEFAISCGSDNVLVKYNLYSSVQGTPETMKVVLKANGMADGKIRSDQKLIALAGWDGRIRLFSAKTLKPLAVLKYHREGLYCLGFAVIKEQEREEAPSSQLTSSDDKSAAALMTSDLAGSTAPAKDSTADAISKGENDKGTRDSSQSNDGDVGMSSGESSSESEDESALEDAIADRQRWSNRHWIAVGGKEQRISLWDIY